MKITIEKTTLVVSAYGVPMHVWEGKTESGMRVACLVDHFMVESEDRPSERDAELSSMRAPSAGVVAAFPAVIGLEPTRGGGELRRRGARARKSDNVRG